MITPNVAEFTRSADFFIKNKCYTKAPRKSKDWYDFWKEETRRCEEGYQVGDYKITGEHYFFLNFTPMKITIGEGKTSKKELLFPRFNLLDYNWFWSKQIARWGIEEEIFNKLDLYWKPNKEDAVNGGKHLVCTKTRGCGFSYKAASHGSYNYNFIRKSKTFYFASNEKYLLGIDGILLKCWDDLEFLNKSTDNWWRKNRQEIDNSWTKKASLKIKTPTGTEIKGYESMIGGIIVPGHNPDAVRGGRGELLIFEEAGSFANLKKAVEVSKALVEDDTTVTGQIIVFGTGGNEDQEGIQGLEDIFYSPEMHNFMRFENIWDENDLGEFGFFVPCTAYSPKHTDEYGNPLWEESRKEWEEKRDKKKKSKDFKDLDMLMAERPFTPAESFKRTTSNVFADAMYFVSEQIRNIENNKIVQGNIKHGTIFSEGGKYSFVERTDARPILKYPHKNNDDLNGCFTIYEDPCLDTTGKPVLGLYTVVVDPFAVDDAEDKTSIGVAYVIKHTTVEYGLGDKIVASVIGRPTFVQKFYERVLYIAEYYGATIQSEIQGGGQGLKDYLKAKNKLHLAEFEPNHILHGKELDKNIRNRSYFMKISDDMKKIGLLYFAEWLLKERHIAVDNKPILNVHMIYDLGLLQEIAKFSLDPKKNFDRCLIKGTNILTRQGYKKIEDIVIGEEVRTLSGELNSVYLTHKNLYKGNIIKFRPCGQYNFIEATEEHPILIRRYDKKPYGKYWYELKSKLPSPKWIDAKDIKKGDFVLIPKRKSLAPAKYSDELLYLLGWYISDGWACNKNNIVKIYLADYQYEIGKELVSIINKNFQTSEIIAKGYIDCNDRIVPDYKKSSKTKAKISKSKDANMWVVEYSNRIFHEFVTSNCGTTNNKIIKEDLFNSSGLLPFIKGYFEGDGHYRSNIRVDGYFRCSLEALTIYENLSFQIRQILIDLGIWSNVRFLPVEKKKKTCKNAYNLQISGIECEKITKGSKKFSQIPYQGNWKRKNYIETEEGFWIPIKEITTYETEQEVYNISVNNDETYVANNVLTHNCSAMLLAMYMFKEKEMVATKPRKKSDFFNRPLFQSGNSSNMGKLVLIGEDGLMD